MTHSINEKRKALETLTKHSFFLSEEAKNQILEKLDSMNEEDIDSIGKFLATEKKIAIANAQKEFETKNKS